VTLARLGQFHAYTRSAVGNARVAHPHPNALPAPNPLEEYLDVFRSRKPIWAFIVALLCSLAITSSAGAVTAPYVEDFESEPLCTSITCGDACPLSTSGWVNDLTDTTDRDWFVDEDGTPSSGVDTGPLVDHNPGTTDGNYLFIETSGGCASTPYTANLISPPLEFTGTTAPSARFWYHHYGLNIGELHVDVLDASLNVLQLDVIAPIVGGNIDMWFQTPTISLVPFLSEGTVHVRIRAEHLGAGFEGDQAVDDFEFFDLSDDVAVTAIAPLGGCGATATETIAVDITNFGANTASNIPISFTVNGGAPVSETVPGPIVTGATATYTFTATADLSVPNAYDIEVTTALPADATPSNDSLLLTTATTPKIAIAGSSFVDDLEDPNTPLFWVSGGAGSEWEYGTPTDALVGGVTSGANAWATDLNSTYSADADNFLESLVCYDLTNVTNAAIAVQINYDLEDGNDGVVLQATTDDGITWTTVGDAVTGTNWYNSSTIASLPGGAGTGWTGDAAAGTNGAYVVATTDLSAFAGASEVRFRFVMTSDGSLNDEGFAFDDFGVFDVVNANVAVAQVPLMSALVGAPAGATDVPVQTLILTGSSPNALSINSLAITKTGTIADADISNARLWLDDGNDVFDPALDTLIDTQMISIGGATFNTTGQLTLANFVPTTLFVTYDIGAGAMPGDTFGSSIAMATDLVEAGAASISLDTTPLAGLELGVFGPVAPPIVDDFNSNVAARTIQISGDFPTATAVGTTVGTTSFANDGVIAIGPPAESLVAIDGPNVLQMEWTNGIAAGALDYYVDLSGFDPTMDPFLLEFRWSDNGEEDVNDAEYVFVSTDGGATWAAAIYDIDPISASDNTWQDVRLDLSALFVQYGLSFTNNVVIRFQGQDDTGFNGPDGYQFDRVFIGRAGIAEVERVAGTPIPNNTTDALGPVTATTQSLTYTINNLGDLPLTIDDQSFTTSSAINVSGIAITPASAPIVVPAGGSTTIQLDFAIDAEGPFGFTVSYEYTAEGDATPTPYSFTLSGVGAAEGPEIDIQRPMGTSVASGQVDVQGEVEFGTQQTLTYTIENVGFADLSVSGATIANATNATAQVSAAPNGTVAPMTTTTLEVTYTPTAAGVFSFDIEVANSDADEAPYIITVYGFGLDPNGGVGGGGPATTTTTGAGGEGGSASGTGAGGGSVDPGEDDGGCSCRVPSGGNGNSTPGLIALAALGLVVSRRRRRHAA